MKPQLAAHPLVLAVSLLGAAPGICGAASMPQSQFLDDVSLSPAQDGVALAQGLDSEDRYLRTVRRAGLELCRGLEAGRTTGQVRSGTAEGQAAPQAIGPRAPVPALLGAPALANVPAQPRIFGTF
jgi:hypothetical protein